MTSILNLYTVFIVPRVPPPPRLPSVGVLLSHLSRRVPRLHFPHKKLNKTLSYTQASTLTQKQLKENSVDNVQLPGLCLSNKIQKKLLPGLHFLKISSANRPSYKKLNHVLLLQLPGLHFQTKLRKTLLLPTGFTSPDTIRNTSLTFTSWNTSLDGYPAFTSNTRLKSLLYARWLLPNAPSRRVL